MILAVLKWKAPRAPNMTTDETLQLVNGRGRCYSMDQDCASEVDGMKHTIAFLMTLTVIVLVMGCGPQSEPAAPENPEVATASQGADEGTEAMAAEMAEPAVQQPAVSEPAPMPEPQAPAVADSQAVVQATAAEAQGFLQQDEWMPGHYVNDHIEAERQAEAEAGPAVSLDDAKESVRTLNGLMMGGAAQEEIATAGANLAAAIRGYVAHAPEVAERLRPTVENIHNQLLGNVAYLQDQNFSGPDSQAAIEDISGLLDHLTSVLAN